MAKSNLSCNIWKVLIFPPVTFFIFGSLSSIQNFLTYTKSHYFLLPTHQYKLHSYTGLPQNLFTYRIFISIYCSAISNSKEINYPWADQRGYRFLQDEKQLNFGIEESALLCFLSILQGIIKVDEVSSSLVEGIRYVKLETLTWDWMSTKGLSTMNYSPKNWH